MAGECPIHSGTLVGRMLLHPIRFTRCPKILKTVWATVCRLLVLRTYVRGIAEVPLAERSLNEKQFL